MVRSIYCDGFIHPIEKLERYKDAEAACAGMDFGQILVLSLAGRKVDCSSLPSWESLCISRDRMSLGFFWIGVVRRSGFSKKSEYIIR